MNLTVDDQLQRSIDSLASRFEKREPTVHPFQHYRPLGELYEARRRDFAPVKVKHQRVRRSVSKALFTWTLLK